MLYAGVPGDLSAKPTLSVLVDSKVAQTVTVRLPYLAEGFDWAAHYVADRAADGRPIGLTGWVTVAHAGVTSLPNPQPNVVAGRSHTLYSPPVPPTPPCPPTLLPCPRVPPTTHPPQGPLPR